MAKKRFNASWLHQHLHDPYVQLAQREGYRTRAAYKLKEIDEQDQLIRPGQIIVDLGAAPGSWSQYIHHKLTCGLGHRHQGRHLGANQVARISGTIIALDKLAMMPLPDVQFIQGDIRDEAVFKKLAAAVGERNIDLVLSDMAPNLSGIAAADAARIEHLCELALEFAQCFLKPKRGALLVKCFYGSGYSQIVEKFKRCFQSVVARKPRASRDRSAEVFILGKCLRSSKFKYL